MFEFLIRWKKILVNAIRLEIRRFRGLKVCILWDLVRLSLFPPLPGGKRERERGGGRMRERQIERKKERGSSMIPLTRLSSVSSDGQAGRQAGRDEWANVPLDESKRGGNDEREEREDEKGRRRCRRRRRRRWDSARRKVGRLITWWRSTSLCRDRQGQNPTGRGKDEGDGRTEGGKMEESPGRAGLSHPARFSLLFLRSATQSI